MSNATCPLCARNLGRKPVVGGGGAVGMAGDFFLECDKGHERLIYSALTKDWSTKSDDVAKQLSAKGYVVRKDGGAYTFGDSPERNPAGTSTGKPWWKFW